MEKTNMGKCHSNVVLVGSFNNIIISDGAARLGNEGDTTLVGALYIITKWEEGVRA